MTRFGGIRYDQYVVLRLLPVPASSALLGRHDELDALAARVLEGDAVGVRTFVTAVGPHLLRGVRRVLGPNHPEVEDVTQEAAFAVIGALRSYRGEASIVHFACRIAVQTAVKVRRREATLKRRQIGEAVDPDLIVGAGADPDVEAEARASAQLVRELIATLPEPQAEALALHCVLGFTVSEIALTAGLPLETVRSRLRLAKNALRKQARTTPGLSAWVEETG